jgi:hypothetical protein
MFKLKNTPKLLTAVVALTLVFGACKKDFGITNDVLVTGKQEISTIVWNGQADKNVAVNIDAVQSLRPNASGPKITSNAHSAAFPGIYFIWDSKQKDNGYLKVQQEVFYGYICFTLTAKESNTYWDFEIYPREDQELTADGCYVFYIPKVYNNKNINMVFVGQTRERTITPPIIVEPPVIEGNKYIFISHPTQDHGTIVDPRNIWNLVGGTHIKNHWNTAIINNGYATDWNAMMNIQTQNGVQANWVWDRDDSWEYGISGAQYLMYISTFTIADPIVETTVPFYFACDNAAVVYVNGVQVAFTTAALEGRFVPGYTQMFNGCGYADFDGDKWQHLYTVDIKPYLTIGNNEIKVLAANSNENDGRWNKENNPAGLIFACEFSTYPEE